MAYIYGKPGSGKTRSVYDNNNIEDIYKPDISQDKIWFDGYNG